MDYEIESYIKYVYAFLAGMIFACLIMIVILFVYDKIGYLPSGGELVNESQIDNYVKYNVTEVEEEAKKEIERYFNVNIGKIEIRHYTGNWSSRSQAVSVGYSKRIDMFLRKSETKYYVDFSHEICHIALWNIGISSNSLSGKYIQESVCMAYPLFLVGEDRFKEVYGMDAETEDARPYYFITSKLKQKDNIDCLKGIFVKWARISNENELKKRFEKECDIDWTEIK